MPFRLDNNDISIIRSLLQDGRKSFRQISRETGITTPTVKARYERLINIGFIKGIFPVFDFGKVHKSQDLIQIQNIKKNDIEKNQSFDNNYDINTFNKDFKIEEQLTNGLAISLVCDYCHGPILGIPRVLKFADLERFFCCTSCKGGYTEKYKGRIDSIKRKYEGKSEI